MEHFHSMPDTYYPLIGPLRCFLFKVNKCHTLPRWLIISQIFLQRCFWADGFNHITVTKMTTTGKMGADKSNYVTLLNSRTSVENWDSAAVSGTRWFQAIGNQRGWTFTSTFRAPHLKPMKSHSKTCPFSSINCQTQTLNISLAGSSWTPKTASAQNYGRLYFHQRYWSQRLGLTNFRSHHIRFLYARSYRLFP